MQRAVKVLVVDDMAMVREIIARGLAADPGIEVVGTASDPNEAFDKINKLSPDVMTLDVEMPIMNGVEFLKKLMPTRPLPVVMVSSFTDRGGKITLEALDAGAVDFVAKPRASDARGLGAMMMELRTKVKIASTARIAQWKRGDISAKVSAPPPPRPATPAPSPAAARPIHPPPPSMGGQSGEKIIVIGASTGGTEAIREVISELPGNTPGVVIVQHMPSGFTRMFAERLNTLCDMEVAEANDGDWITPGKVLIAPGGKQMRVERSGGKLRVSVKQEPTVNGHCPSVEVLMLSAATAVRSNAVGVMLTGMGGDGAIGLKAMRDAGARTLAQDEATCVVFGMPKVAWEKGGAEKLVPLGNIAAEVLSLVSKI